ncbi:MAG TPA: TolC family protein, partial [Smithellaceae bacterium]|nr:TolC family protein [Smithellaceae bacterium]
MLFLLLLIFLIGSECYGADAIGAGNVLNLQQCIDIALRKHPDLSAAKGTVKASESKIGQARASYYPQLTFQSGYDRSGTSAPSSLRSDPYNKYSNYLT